MHRFLRASRSVRWQSSPTPATRQTLTRAATFCAFTPHTTSRPATVLAGRALVSTQFPATLLARRHLATVVGSTSSSSAPPADRTPNAFVDWTLFPNFTAILPQCTPDKAVPAFELFVERIEREFVERESKFEPTWEGSIGAVQDLEDQVERAYGIISHLNGVKNSPELRKVMEQVQPLIIKLTLLMNQSLPKFRALSTLRSTPATWAALDPVQQRIVDLALKDMHLAGVGLAPESPEKARFNAILEQLSRLGMRFSNNVLDATLSFSEVVRDRAELVGCSGELLAMLAANARKRAIAEEADAEKGPWCVTLDGPTYIPFMMGCENRALREKIYRASVTKASEGKLNNEPLINEILNLKQEQAAILGFSSYASLSLSTKMARDVPSAQRLLSSLFASSLPAARRELATLTSFAAETLGHPVPLQPWDTAYIAEAYRKQTLRLDEEEVARYLAFPRVLEGLFEVAKEVLGVTVRDVAPEERRKLGLETWHEDVRVFKVEEGGMTRAYFYGDFYSRPEEKRGGAWMDLVTTRMRERGGVRVPVAYLICNQSPPSSSSKPSLMKFSDVRTLFHEFGHCLQHMLTTVDYPQASGIKAIEWDFVEVASQFMENFCFEPEWLARLAAHHETGEPMPREMIDALVRNRELLSGMAMLRQIHFAMVDLNLHSDFRPPSAPGDRTVFDVDAEIAHDTILVPRLPEDRFLCAFNHIFAGGYSAGYYSYKWSETYSADAYAAFEEARATSVSADAVRRMGERYRDTVLALGGGTAPREVWRRFRGREEVDVGALLKHSGLVTEA